MKKRAVFVLVIVFGVLDAKATTFVDQRWERPEPYIAGASSHSIYFSSAIGQEFTPTFDNIIAVELAISASTQNIPPGEIPSITVKIRDDVITGNILAATSILPSENTDLRWLYFDFGGVISIIAGNRYVIDVSTTELVAMNWMWRSWEDTSNIGIPGHRMILGDRQDVGFASSFGFRTYAIPEPCTLFLLGLGGLMLRRKRRA